MICGRACIISRALGAISDWQENKQYALASVPHNFAKTGIGEALLLSMVRFECVLAVCIFEVCDLAGAPSVAGGDTGELLA